jgi:hypothetical protein
MAILLQIGHITAAEVGESYGHVACTLGGVNYESCASRGVIKGSAARGATDKLFKRTFHILLSEKAARKALHYGNLCVGQDYVLGRVPTRHQGGDCSGFISGILCRAKGEKLARLFSTANWLDVYKDLGFSQHLGGGHVLGKDISAIGRPDRPYPGHVFRAHTGVHLKVSNNVTWVQSRLNYAARDVHHDLHADELVENGLFDAKMLAVVKQFQAEHERMATGHIGPVTWGRLNSLR